MEAANSYVRIRTDCADVRSIKPVGKDFHLLVVNASAQATVEVSAIDPWELVEPISGSCSVTLAAEGAYEVKDAEPDEEGNREPNKDGRIIMFKPIFSVSPSFPSGVYELKEDASGEIVEHVIENTRGDLTDNHTSIVNVYLIGGIGSLTGHEATMPVRPEMSGRPLLHHESVDPNNVSVQIDVSKNKWTTSKIFWYGLSDMANGCCYWNRFNYIFELYVDGILCDSHKYNVGWPRDSPRCETHWVGMSRNEESEDIGNGRFRVKLKIADFHRESNVAGVPVSNQYATEVLREENYHKSQDLCQVPVEKGGEGDLFTAKGIFYCITNFCTTASFLGQCGVSNATTVQIEGNDVFVYSDDDLTAELDAVKVLDYFESLEYTLSRNLKSRRRQHIEFWAKRYAGYNAAWKYHCTYGRGSEEEPSYEKHPAFAAEE